MEAPAAFPGLFFLYEPITETRRSRRPIANDETEMMSYIPGKDIRTEQVHFAGIRLPFVGCEVVAFFFCCVRRISGHNLGDVGATPGTARESQFGEAKM